MQVETKFVRLKTPVSLGSRFGDWEVTWRGGWTQDRLSWLVMIGRVRPARAAAQRRRSITAV